MRIRNFGFVCSGFGKLFYILKNTKNKENMNNMFDFNFFIILKNIENIKTLN